MTLIVEDGTGITGANSYISLSDARAYALARGVTLSADDAALESELTLAMDWLESFRGSYQGIKTDQAYSLQWPRYGVYIDGYSIDSDYIPSELANAQVQLAIAIENGITLQPSYSAGDSAFIIEDTVGPITTKYSERNGGSATEPLLIAVNSLLAPLLKKSAGFQTLRV